MVRSFEQSTGSSSADIEKELDHIVKQIEGKMEQIEVVKKLLKEKRRNKDKGKDRTAQAHSNIRQVLDSDIHKDSLQVLRKMKRLQTTLQRDDLSWN